MFHSRNVDISSSLVDSSPNVVFMVVAKKFNVGLITSNNLFQMFWGLSLCCFVAYCKQAASWHWHSNGFLPVTRPCSPFFFLCLFVEHLETAGPLFFSRVLYVSWSYLWVFLCIPNNYPGSCGWNFCPYFLNGVWSVLNGILNSLDIFLYPCPPRGRSDTKWWHNPNFISLVEEQTDIYCELNTTQSYLCWVGGLLKFIYGDVLLI